ncbi:MAG TPA: hypothetical protein VFQ57_05160, partial [Sphingomonas sp.]|nr:hypothetical protein [Sphingomonas sp.]
DAVLAWDDRLARCASSEAMIARSGMVAPARKAMRLAVADLHARLSQWGWAPLGDAFGLVIEGTRVALLRAQDALPALGSTPVLWEDGAEGHAFGALDPDDAEMDAAYEATLH